MDAFLGIKLKSYQLTLFPKRYQQSDFDKRFQATRANKLKPNQICIKC